MVMRFCGSLWFDDLNADLIRSLLSCTDVSPSHTIVKLGRPAFISTSTLITSLSSPLTTILRIFEIIYLFFLSYFFYMYMQKFFRNIFHRHHASLYKTYLAVNARRMYIDYIFT